MSNTSDTNLYGESFIRQMQPRDSVLIADQLCYGVTLKELPSDGAIELPQLKDTIMQDIVVVKPWTLDTLKTHRKAGTLDMEASMTITSFDEGEYLLPGIPVVLHRSDGSSDTLHFKGQDVLFCTMPVDTASFEIHDIKAQMRYPVTFREVLPYLGGAVVLAGVITAVALLLKRRRQRRLEAERHDPPHIVALRKLDAYRGDKYWAPAKQKQFYSGVTDALREYISARYNVGAMEMTTAEIFNAIKGQNIPEDILVPLRELFECSDYVKFAKHVASDNENAAVLPLGVKFVTSTYQEEIQEESANA